MDCVWASGYFDTSSPVDNHPKKIHYKTVSSSIVDNALRDLSDSRASAAATSTDFTNDIAQPDVFLTYDSLVEQFELNDKQKLAFRIISDHSLGKNKVGPQLRMGVFGEGGTGKSRLIAAIRAWFKSIHREDDLLIAATTGSAAVKISGTTVHSAAGIPVEDEDPARMKPVNPAKLAEWRDRNYMVIDEVSMMDSKVMERLHTRLSTIKSNPDQDFGGVNLIFVRDFLQLPSVPHLDLYNNNPSSD